jgi:hypothetical protein
VADPNAPSQHSAQVGQRVSERWKVALCEAAATVCLVVIFLLLLWLPDR